jgi:uncharacterized protein
MGKVGGLVSAFLAKNLKSEYIAEIVSDEKPCVSYFDGIVKIVSDLYRVYYDAEHNLLFSQEIHSHRTQANSTNYVIDFLIIFIRLVKSGVYTAQEHISTRI